MSDGAADGRPVLRGPHVTIRFGNQDDVPLLRAVLSEESVTRWWGPPEEAEPIAANLAGTGSSVLLVVEVDGHVAGGIQYDEEEDPMYRHASIDIFLGSAYQGRGAGPEAIGLLTRFLCDRRDRPRPTPRYTLRPGSCAPPGRTAASCSP